MKHNANEVDPILLEAYRNLVSYLGKDNDLSLEDKTNYEDTAVRAAKAFAEMTATRSEIKKQLKEIISTSFPLDGGNKNSRAGITFQGDIRANGTCPHHLLPVSYRVHVAYLPSENGQVLGLSKMARIVRALASRPCLQEQLAQDIADVLFKDEERIQNWPSIESAGSAVQVIGVHSCMALRGVRSEAQTVATVIRGDFWDNGMEQKFYQNIQSIHNRI